MFDALNRMAPLVQQLDEAGYGRLATRTAAHLDSLAVTTRRLDSLMVAGLDAEATERFETRVEPRLDRVRATFDAIAAAIDERSGARVREAEEVSAAAQRTLAIAVAAGLVLTLLVGAWTTRALSRPLERLSEATSAVADGEFSPPADLPYDRDDEIGELSRSFGAMTERLAELDRLKAEFVSLASHELKTPINVIS
nr:HAMP domain-containing protein [Gemmatimonadota bacterium]NIU73848.1 HAMP domain-containing protein [Gammaproteobacteria bacterium]